MRTAIAFSLLLGGALFAGSAALADEVIIHRDAPPAPPGVEGYPPFPSAGGSGETVIEHRPSRHCETKTVHRENDMGESTTVEKRRCED